MSKKAETGRSGERETEQTTAAHREVQRKVREAICRNWSRHGVETAMTEYHGDFLLRGPQSLWLPAIPLPLQTWRKTCWACKRRFWTMEGYEAHYVFVHVLKAGR